MKLATAAALLLPASASAIWGGANTDAAVVKPKARSLQDVTGDFSPLTCNSNLDSATCGSWTFGSAPTEQVTIPCGTCVDMSTAPAAVNAAFGINVEGRMHFPDGTETHISTPHLFVQGKLSMDLANGPIGADPDVKITMTGVSDQILTPNDQNAAVCPGGCNVGPKAVVVAGGELDINAIDDTCPTWSFVENYVDEGTPNPTSGFPVAPTLTGSCTTTLLSQNFEGGLDEWWGNLGAPFALATANGQDGNYLQVSRRTDTWQGPYRELHRSAEGACLQPDVVYIFSAKVRLDPSAEHPTHQSSCSSTGTNCPALRMQYMKENDYVVWRDLVVTDRAPADGNWYEITGSFVTDLEWSDANNIFSTITINGPEKEVDISVDDVLIKAADASLYPDPANVCGDLVTNGDAEAGVAFPFRNYMSTKPLMVVEDASAAGNKVFFVPEREKSYHTLAFEAVPGCLVPGSVYQFKAKIRVDSDVDIVPRLQYKAEAATSQTEYVTVGACPKTGQGRGFVQCTFDITLGDEAYNADRVTFFLNLISADAANAGWTADAYYDDVSLAFSTGLDSGGIQLDAAVTDQCYAAGAEAVIPSDDLDYSRSQVVTLKSASAGLVNVDENTVRIPTTRTRSPEAAGQFAFLSRRVVFEGDGGYIAVLNTPSVAQTIKGVGVVGFGQEGVDGRNPIAFIGSSGASVVAKNAIRSSKNRCINLANTDNLSVEMNVAYDTVDHCFAVTGGQGNTFSSNLGALTKKTSANLDPATYYIASVGGNSFSDNVAGGSQSTGFLIDTLDAGVPSLFSGNVAHSNLIAGFDTSEGGYNPSSQATLQLTRSFRNTGPGVRLRSSSNVRLQGGFAADNRDGVLVWKGDGIEIGGMDIVGQTPVYEDLLVVPGTPRLCTGLEGGPDVGGVRVHPNGGSTTGVLLVGNNFAGFSTASGCQSASGGGTSAVAFVDDDPNMDLASTAKIEVQGLTFAEGSEPRDEVNLCAAADRGVYGITVLDLDGSLDPEGTSPLGGSAYISEGMSCSTGVIDVSAACAGYCKGGVVAAGTPPAPAPGPGDTPTGPTGEATTCISDGDFQNGVGEWRAGPNAVWSELDIVTGKDGGFAGRSYMRRSPTMSGMWQDMNPTCFSADDWYEISADIRFIHNVTLADHPCDPYNMWYGSPLSCPFGTLVISRNPLQRIEAASIVGPLSTVPDTNGVVWQKLYGAFKATSDITGAGDFPLIFSSAPDYVDLIVDNVAITKVTDVAASVGAVDCSSPIVNGNFETGDLRGWYARGTSNGGDLSLVTGEGGAGSALRHAGARTQRWHGIVQLVPHECFDAGSSFEITAKFRIFDKSDGSPVACNKGDPLADDSCPAFELSPEGDRNWEYRDGPLVNADPSPMITGAWNTIRNIKTISAQHAAFATRYSWFTINSVDPAYGYEIDNIVMTKL
mmetsp:Transcript_9179/g.27606  ORF Transcript_9179/g.27606 Transcript_9179/m.27606 type:complete len:1426 (-) Transcript_9179:247-4524(-)